ncbi:aspartic peptidase domain-containing protein [Mycena amicta]|nr:aspartic peptidase domain-containing protein [Mycena amicta]
MVFVAALAILVAQAAALQVQLSRGGKGAQTLEDYIALAQRTAKRALQSREEDLALIDGAGRLHCLILNFWNGRQDSDSFYYTELSIGTPPQKINVLLATTSADIIVAGKPCTGGCPTADVKSYDHRISSSVKNLSTDGKTQTLGFGGDSITGFLFADTIVLQLYTFKRILMIERVLPGASRPPSVTGC